MNQSPLFHQNQTLAGFGVLTEREAFFIASRALRELLRFDFGKRRSHAFRAAIQHLEQSAGVAADVGRARAARGGGHAVPLGNTGTTTETGA